MRIGLSFTFAVAITLSASGAALADDTTVVTSPEAPITNPASGAVPPADNTVAASKGGLFTDPEDGHFDMSRWLLEHRGFLPVPIIVTDPAVGYGGGLGLAFFNRPEGSSPTRTRPDGSIAMIAPDIYGIGAMKTQDGTKALGFGGIMHFDNDTWRYRGGVGLVDMNLDFYTNGALIPQQKIGVNMKGIMSAQQVFRRIGDQDLFLIGSWIYMDIDPRLNVASDRAFLTDLDFKQRSSALGLALEYDTRDNPFTPSSGYEGALDTYFYDKAFGSDVTFQSYRAHLFGYWPLAKSVVLGLRADGRMVNGDVPFYRLPYIDLRGIPSARYQGQRVGMLESEIRWNVTPRWGLVGFTGVGRAWGGETTFNDASSEISKGVGFRYEIARKLGLHVGVDYAWGPENKTFYIQVGSAWR